MLLHSISRPSFSKECLAISHSIHFSWIASAVTADDGPELELGVAMMGTATGALANKSE